jgi:hypothetical protein
MDEGRARCGTCTIACTDAVCTSCRSAEVGALLACRRAERRVLARIVLIELVLRADALTNVRLLSHPLCARLLRSVDRCDLTAARGTQARAHARMHRMQGRGAAGGL